MRDALNEHEAHLDVTLFGFIPVAHGASSPALIRAELMRYLAELAWVPDAIIFNTGLRWRVDGPDTFAVGAGIGNRAAKVILGLDSDGRIATAFAADRLRSVTAPFRPTPWRGRCSDYRLHEGRWLPFSGEVGWEIDGTDQTYWQGRVDSWGATSEK